MATAAIVPTHAVMLVDLSRGSVIESHRPYFLYGTQNVSEYTFELDNKICGADKTNPCKPITDAEVCLDMPMANAAWPPSDCTFKGGLWPGYYTAII
jgi:hypothetical protein